MIAGEVVDALVLNGNGKSAPFSLALVSSYLVARKPVRCKPDLLYPIVVFALVLVVGYAAVKQLDFGFDSVEVGVASYRTDHSSRRSLLATGADWEKCSFENGSGMGGCVPDSSFALSLHLLTLFSGF